MANKKLLSGLIIYFAILAIYLGFAISNDLEWKNSLNEWRQNKIRNSPKVCVTNTGVKYHNCYHYQNRNSSLSLFEANEQGYSPCGTCNPPKAPEYFGKPKKPPFYLYYWFIISILFSVLCWIIYKQLIKKL